MPSAVKWRMLASAGTLAGVASVLRAQRVLEVSDLALFQAPDSTIVTTVASMYRTERAARQEKWDYISVLSELGSIFDLKR